MYEGRSKSKVKSTVTFLIMDIESSCLQIYYPHMFGSEGAKYPGVVAIRDILPGEAILAIPFDQLVSVRRMDPDLKDLIRNCPLFTESADSEHL